MIKNGRFEILFPQKMSEFQFRNFEKFVKKAATLDTKKVQIWTIGASLDKNLSKRYYTGQKKV